MDHWDAPANWSETTILFQRLLYHTLKDQLIKISIPPGGKLFTCDKTSMYKNIRTGPAIEHISCYLHAECGRTYHYYNMDALIEAIHIVFKNNIITFGDYWKQISGTGMAISLLCLGHSLLWTVRDRTIPMMAHKQWFLPPIHWRRDWHIYSRPLPSHQCNTLELIQTWHATVAWAPMDIWRPFHFYEFQGPHHLYCNRSPEHNAVQKTTKLVHLKTCTFTYPHIHPIQKGSKQDSSMDKSVASVIYSPTKMTQTHALRDYFHV